MKRLTAREGFAFWIDGSGFHYRRRKQDAAPAHALTWYSDERGEGLSIQRRIRSRAARQQRRGEGRDPMG